MNEEHLLEFFRGANGMRRSYMSKHGPMTYRAFIGIPETAAVDMALKPEQVAYASGVNEGIRWERNNQLRDMAKAAMPLLTEGMFHNCDEEHVPHSEVINWLYDFAEAMLAESDKRRSSCDETL